MNQRNVIYPRGKLLTEETSDSLVVVRRGKHYLRWRSQLEHFEGMVTYDIIHIWRALQE